MRRSFSLLMIFAVSLLMLNGCVLFTVADAATSLAVGAVKTTAKVAGAAVDAVIPDGK